VIVCTRNRADLLRLALQSLAAQSAPPESFEVLVVDNGSTDHTSAVVDGCRALLDLRCVREDRTGLSYARNRGYAEAMGAYVAFLDDDAKARQDWVANICRAIEEDEPDIFGGPHFPAFIEPKPDWFPDARETWFLGDEARHLEPDEHVIGVNMIVRKAVLERLGGFRTDLGMIGAAMGYGEDTDLQERVRREVPGARLLYCPDVVVYHVVRPEQAALGWYLRRAVRRGLQAGSVYDARSFFPGRLPRLKSAAYAVGHLGLGVLNALACPLRSRRAYPHYETYLLERVFPHVHSVLAYCSFAFRGGWRRGRGRAAETVDSQ
jgi:glycosyltransferase involved in cell wall biosynthesis